MTSSQEIEMALFDAASNLEDAGARRDFLDQACGDDAALRKRLEGLLLARDTAEDFFSPPVSDEPPLTPRADGTAPADEVFGADGAEVRIGRYRLIQRLGEGGCGVVYLAEQEEPVRRQVALKIIRMGMDTESVIARFTAERQALAMMDHPNIARVLDAGATRTGRPYFVMELVRGVRLTEYCDEHRLDIASRLELFIRVCQAIQHAHQKGVIHRDIKPSNILVTMHDGQPVPKVIDFGIAKATEAGRTRHRTVFSIEMPFLGTPAYMSPEQADGSGIDVDTRSDIYSLGVLLYELLAGRTPLDSLELRTLGVEEMRRVLREREPRSPSDLLKTLPKRELLAAAQARQTEWQRLIALLQGDLDWVVMRALEKDRQRRYETANELANDVRRFLRHEPVAARPISRLYRFAKLVRRNRVAFAAVGAVAIALVAGLTASTWLLVRERDARMRAVAAERQQALLLAEAQRGRITEAHMREQAEAREKMARVAVLVSQDRLEEADQLMESIPLSAEGIEGATLLRTLGDWNAMRGRWDKAGDRYTLLVQASKFDMLSVSTLDQTRYATVLIERGDMAGYERFRQAMLANYVSANDPVVAERTVKLALLTEPDARLMRSLVPLAELAARSFYVANPGADFVFWQAPWRCVSMALMEYRRGRYAESIAWANRCLSYGDKNESRVACIQAILVMARFRQGEKQEAAALLSALKPQVEARFKNRLDYGDGGHGFWFDWLMARILVREGAALVEDNIQ
jgi:hypothetical protein